MTDIPYTRTPHSISLVLDSRIRVINKTHQNFSEVEDFIKYRDTDTDRLRALVDIPTFIAEKTFGRVQVSGSTIRFDDRDLHGVLCDRLLAMLNGGFDIAPLAKFLDNLMDNPLESARDELYLFLEQSGSPITPDGHFLAWKKVNDEYKDQYSGTFDNSVGAICEMPREEVCDNRAITCSHGLHFAAFSYLKDGYLGRSGHIMIVKVNPADVVSVPHDYANAKGRTWRYEVVGEVPYDEAEKCFPNPVDTTWGTDFGTEPGGTEFKIEYGGDDPNFVAPDVDDTGDYVEPYDTDYDDPYGDDARAEIEDEDEIEHGYDRYGYDENGYNVHGYDRDGFDKDGDDAHGNKKYDYDPEGIFAPGGARSGYDTEGYNVKGYDQFGYDRFGNDKEGVQDPGIDDPYAGAPDEDTGELGYDPGWDYPFDSVRDAIKKPEAAPSIIIGGIEVPMKPAPDEPYVYTPGFEVKGNVEAKFKLLHEEDTAALEAAAYAEGAYVFPDVHTPEPKKDNAIVAGVKRLKDLIKK